MSDDKSPGWPWLGVYEPLPSLSHYRPVIAEFGMVSTPHHLATTIGLDVLRDGGNAVDAAVAASAALMVTVPMNCSPGGDAIWLINAPDGAVECLDCTGWSSENSSAHALRGQGLTSIPLRSATAVTVPGAVDGWVNALRRHGTRPLAELLEPAARLAERGFFVGRHLHASFRIALPVLRATGAMALWSADASPPPRYSRLCQPHLADALRSIGKTDGRALYEGDLARAIVDVVTAAGGHLSLSDLANYRSEWTAPLKARFRDLTLYTSPPSTQGVALLETLRLVECLSPAPLDPASPDAVHLMVEAMSIALEDRDRFVGDPSGLAVEPVTLYEPDRVASLAERFDPRHARDKERMSGAAKDFGDTAHLTVVDRDRRAVSLIQSLFFDFGTGIPVPAGGFTLQNRGAAFSLESGSVNELRPRRRPRTTLAPSIAQRDGALSISLGCMGGDGQMQTQIQLLVAMVDAGLDPQQAVSSPRWYLDRASGPQSRVLFESRMDEALVAGMQARGHTTAVLGASEEVMGHAQVIAVERTGSLVGAADPRSDGQVGGW